MEIRRGGGGRCWPKDKKNTFSSGDSIIESVEINEQ
jgi:hypothetical protein